MPIIHTKWHPVKPFSSIDFRKYWAYPVPGYNMRLLFLLIALCAPATQAQDRVNVRGYIKKDGTFVAPHERSRPNALKWDNDDYKPSEKPFNESYSNPTKNYGAEWLAPNAHRFVDDNPNNDTPNFGWLDSTPNNEKPAPAHKRHSAPLPEVSGFSQDEASQDFGILRKERKSEWSSPDPEPLHTNPDFLIPAQAPLDYSRPKPKPWEDKNSDPDVEMDQPKPFKVKAPTYGLDDEKVPDYNFGGTGLNSFGRDEPRGHEKPDIDSLETPTYSAPALPSYEQPASPTYPPENVESDSPPSYEYKPSDTQEASGSDDSGSGE